MSKLSLYIILILIIAFEFIFILPFEFYPEASEESPFDAYRTIAPGVLFSLFIVFLHFRKWSIARMLLMFVLLFVLYFLSFSSGMISWGFAVPIAGSIAALLIHKLIFLKEKLFSNRGLIYLIWGFNCGLLGVLLFYVSLNFEFTEGFGFGIIITLWQILIGLFIIHDFINSETKTH